MQNRFKRYLNIIALTCSCCVAAANPVLAWDSITHRFIAEKAEALLTARTQEKVDALLIADGKGSLADIAMWADAIRELPVGTEPLHTVRLPLDRRGYDAARDCPRAQCALSAIDAAMKGLVNTELPVEARVAALKYIVHLVADIHQPLHATINIGDFNVQFRGKTRTLHDIWDRDLTSRDSLANMPAVAANTSITITQAAIQSWAAESRDIGRDTIFPELQAFVDDKTIRLPDDYAKQHKAVAAQRVQLAIQRLAAVLNGLLGS
jgi:S1/P1 Nuclease